MAVRRCQKLTSEGLRVGAIKSGLRRNTTNFILSIVNFMLKSEHRLISMWSTEGGGEATL
jgi:hypothetical protein